MIWDFIWSMICFFVFLCFFQIQWLGFLTDYFWAGFKTGSFWNVFFGCRECFFVRITIHRSIRYGGQCNLRFDDTNPDTDAWRNIFRAGR